MSKRALLNSYSRVSPRVWMNQKFLGYLGLISWFFLFAAPGGESVSGSSSPSGVLAPLPAHSAPPALYEHAKYLGVFKRMSEDGHDLRARMSVLPAAVQTADQNRAELVRTGVLPRLSPEHLDAIHRLAGDGLSRAESLAEENSEKPAALRAARTRAVETLMQSSLLQGDAPSEREKHARALIEQAHLQHRVETAERAERTSPAEGQRSAVTTPPSRLSAEFLSAHQALFSSPNRREGVKRLREPESPTSPLGGGVREGVENRDPASNRSAKEEKKTKPAHFENAHADQILAAAPHTAARAAELARQTKARLARLRENREGGRTSGVAVTAGRGPRTP